MNEMFLTSWPGYIYKLVGGNFNVFAGGGTQTETDDGVGTEAKFVQLAVIVFDSQDNIYTVSQQTYKKSNTSSSYNRSSCRSSRCSR